MIRTINDCLQSVVISLKSPETITGKFIDSICEAEPSNWRLNLIFEKDGYIKVSYKKIKSYTYVRVVRGEASGIADREKGRRVKAQREWESKKAR